MKPDKTYLTDGPGKADIVINQFYYQSYASALDLH